MAVNNSIYTQAQTIGMGNVVVDGKEYKDVPLRVTFVSQQSDLSVITGANPGDFAATYGFGTMWQMNAADTWVQINA